MARDFGSQVAALQVRIAVLNRSWHARHRAWRVNPYEKGENLPSPDLCNGVGDVPMGAYFLKH